MRIQLDSGGTCRLDQPAYNSEQRATNILFLLWNFQREFNTRTDTGTGKHLCTDTGAYTGTGKHLCTDTGALCTDTGKHLCTDTGTQAQASTCAQTQVLCAHRHSPRNRHTDSSACMASSASSTFFFFIHTPTCVCVLRAPAWRRQPHLLAFFLNFYITHTGFIASSAVMASSASAASFFLFLFLHTHTHTWVRASSAFMASSASSTCSSSPRRSFQIS